MLPRVWHEVRSTASISEFNISAEHSRKVWTHIQRQLVDVFDLIIVNKRRRADRIVPIKDQDFVAGKFTKGHCVMLVAREGMEAMDFYGNIDRSDRLGGS